MRKEKSCGTIIYRYKNNKRQFLLIHQIKGDFMGFPKGHVEIGESDLKTAIRETKEETNLDVFIFDDVKTNISYLIRDEIDKEVVFYLAVALNEATQKQDTEIKDIMWVDEKEVLGLLTHQTTQAAFCDVMKQFSQKTEYLMDIKLVSYLYEKILPIYRSFDQAHQLDHIHQVLKTSLEIAEKISEVKLDLVYVIAFYHDIGNLYGRDKHHLTGGKYLNDDVILKKYFNESEIQIMKEAVEDHRASHEEEPRTMYGKIIAEADREIVPEIIIKRTVQFGFSHYPHLSEQEHIERALEHIIQKYGKNGYLKLWLDSQKNVNGLKKLRSLLLEEDKVRKIIEKYYKECKKMKKTY